MKKIFVIIVLLITNSIIGQQDCENIYFQAEGLFKSGKYQLAIKKLSAYKICSNSNLVKADELLLEIYETIDRQKNEAIKAKQEALRQKEIANKRADTIKQQKDSIENENIANKIATQSLQVNQIDPNTAINYVYTGLCFSPNNSSLNEIRRKILSEEIIYKNIENSSPFITKSLKKLNEKIFLTSDSEGEIKIWDFKSQNLIDRIKLFKSSISCFEIINDTLVIVSGNDSENSNLPKFKVKLLNPDSHISATVNNSEKYSEFTCMTNSGDRSKVFLGNEQGDIFIFELGSGKLTKLKNVKSKIVGIQCLKDLNKVYYATAYGVYDVNSDKTVYASKQDVFITFFSLCQRNGDFYIGIGPDLIHFNFFDQGSHLLYPIHKHLITSCNCSDSTGEFITTSTDNNAVLWSSNGNIKKILKGNKGELYDSYISPKSEFILTAGRRELNQVSNADTSTIKYWYVSQFLRKIKEAHFLGATSAIYATGLNFIISAGVNGFVSIWDEDLNLIESKKISSSGVSSLQWDSAINTAVFGTYTGETGFLKVKENGQIYSSNSIKTHSDLVTSIAIIDKNIYSAGKDGVLYIQNYSNEITDSIVFDAEINEISTLKDSKSILLIADKIVINYDIQSGAKSIFKHNVRINSVKWIDENQFVTISGQFLRIWNLENHQNPVLEIDNNIKNEMTSMLVDYENKLIYTGTWSGYIICSDFLGKQLYEMDQLTSLANTNIINSICGNYDNSKIYSVDYNGNIALWFSPDYFMTKEVNIEVDCAKVLKKNK